MRLRYAFFLLLPLVAAGDLFHYELHGTYSSLKAEHVRTATTTSVSFANQEDAIRSEFSSLLSETDISFYIEEFQIHGEDFGTPTAVFYAYISSLKNREEFAAVMKKSEKISLYFIRQTESRPPVPVRQIETGEALQIVCQNGGFDLPNGTCACPSFYNSRPDCSIASCLNGGIADGNRCACPPGLYGINCEPRGCLPPVQDKFDNSKQTFILVLNQRSSMAYVLNTIITQIGNTIDTLADQNPNFVDNFIVVNYIRTANDNYMNKKFLPDKTSFMSYLAGINTADGTDTQFTNRAIYTAQNFAPYMHGFSNIFVFADTPDDSMDPPNYLISSNTDEILTITKTIAWRNRIVYFLSQPKGTPLDNSMNDFDVYRRIVQSTLGDLLSFDLTEITEILTKVIPAYNQNEVIAATYGYPASQLTEKFTVPASSDPVTLILSVEPNGTLPTVSSNQMNVLSLCHRIQVIQITTGPATLSIHSMNSPWTIRAFVNSPKTALLAYSTDPEIDIGSSYIPAELAPIVSAAQIGYTDLPSFAFVDQNATTLTTPVIGKQRNEECSFPLSFGALNTMATAGPQLIQLAMAGGDTRMIPAFGGYIDHHSPIPFVCYNGNRTGVSSCQCSPLFEGKNCADPVCLYNGVVNPFPGFGHPLCNCPPGFSGDHCEILDCTISSDVPIQFTNNRSLAIVLQSSMSQAQINSKINNGMNALLSALQGDNAFSEFVLTTFNNIIQQGQNYTQIESYPYTDPTDLMYGLRSDNILYKATSTPTQDAFGALYKTMFLMDYDKSSIFLFVDAPVESQFDTNFIIMNAVARQLEISIIITPPYGMTELCMSAGDAQVYANIVQKTGGVIVNLCNSYGTYFTDPIVQFFIGYGSTHHHTENINELWDKNSGDASINLKFIVDNPDAEIYAIVNSVKTETFTVKLTNLDYPNSPQTLNTLASMPFLGTYRITPAENNYLGYLLTTSTGNQGVSIRIIEKTKKSVYLGYSTEPAVDIGSKTMMYGFPNSPVFHLYGDYNLYPPPTVAVQINDDSFTVKYTGTAVPRTSKCKYESFIVDQFYCPSPQNSYIVTTTIKSGDNTYQRTQRAYCYEQDQFCMNGGSFDDNSGNCDCPVDYVGKYCEYPLCGDNGKLVSFACQCNAGFSGTHCQYGTCETWNFMETNDVREQDFKQITFVVNKNMPQLLVMTQLSYILNSFVQQTESKNTPKQYSLITFDENTVNNVVSTAHADRFLQAFHDAVSTVTNTMPTQTRATDALNEAYKINIQPPNIIYLITGTDTLPVSSGSFFAYLRQRIGTQVNVIYTSGNPKMPSDGNFETYVSVAARQSGGRVLPITPNSVGQLTPVLTSTVFEDALIHDDANSDCSSGRQFTFFVENNFNRIIVDVTGTDVRNAGNIFITDGAGRSIILTKNNTLFSDVGAVVYQIGKDDVIPGGKAWTAYVRTTSGSCYIQVRGASPIRIVPGFTSSPTQDFVKSAPFTMSSNNADRMTYMTFRVVDQGFTDVGTSLSTVTIFQTDYYLTFKVPLLRNVKINPRDPKNCANQFIAGPWQMDKTGYQKYIVQGTAGDNSQFQRTFYFNLPSSRDDKPTCVNGQRNTYGECQCNVQFTGGYCSDPICMNGGTTSYGVCACPNGYFGDFCSQYIVATNATTTATPIF